MPQLQRTVLATSEKPLDLCTGIKTLGISAAEVGYDKQFTLANWSFWCFGTMTLKVTGRLAAGVCGPAYTAYLKPAFSYEDSELEVVTYYNYYQKIGGIWGPIPFKMTSKPSTSGGFPYYFASDDSHPYWVSKESKVSRTLKVADSDWYEGSNGVELMGGFNAGAWFIVDVQLEGTAFWKDYSWGASTTINLYEALMAVVSIVKAGNSLLNSNKTSQTYLAIENACKAAKPSSSSSVDFTGSVLEMQSSATSGLNKEAGIELSPNITVGVNMLLLWSDRYDSLKKSSPTSAAAFLASWSSLIAFGEAVKGATKWGIVLYVGPELVLSFPVKVTVNQLAVDGAFEKVGQYEPVAAEHIYVNEVKGANNSWTKPADPAPPTVPTPSSVGLELKAIPSIVLTLQFRVEADVPGLFAKSYVAKLEADLTAIINSIAGGTVPASIKTKFSAPVGNTAAANTTIQSTVT